MFGALRATQADGQRRHHGEQDQQHRPRGQQQLVTRVRLPPKPFVLRPGRALPLPFGSPLRQRAEFPRKLGGAGEAVFRTARHAVLDVLAQQRIGNAFRPVGGQRAVKVAHHGLKQHDPE